MADDNVLHVHLSAPELAMFNGRIRLVKPAVDGNPRVSKGVIRGIAAGVTGLLAAPILAACSSSPYSDTTPVSLTNDRSTVQQLPDAMMPNAAGGTSGARAQFLAMMDACDARGTGGPLKVTDPPGAAHVVVIGNDTVDLGGLVAGAMPKLTQLEEAEQAEGNASCKEGGAASLETLWSPSYDSGSQDQKVDVASAHLAADVKNGGFAPDFQAANKNVSSLSKDLRAVVAPLVDQTRQVRDTKSKRTADNIALTLDSANLGFCLADPKADCTSAQNLVNSAQASVNADNTNITAAEQQGVTALMSGLVTAPA